jgi:S1-C subfamily serine protease
MSPLRPPNAVLLWTGLILSVANYASAQNAAAPPPGGGARTPTVLDPYVVSSKPIGSFGLSVKAIRDGFSAKVAELTILDVVPHSDADRLGLGPLTRILSIDGRSVNEFTASFDKGADLNAKLIDRKRGDRITLEVVVLGAGKPKFVHLVEGRGVHQFANESDSEVEPLRSIHIGFSH